MQQTREHTSQLPLVTPDRLSLKTHRAKARTVAKPIELHVSRGALSE
jgi:hypothetical protein|nr:hypothetical protein [Cupriavidus laharis]